MQKHSPKRGVANFMNTDQDPYYLELDRYLDDDTAFSRKKIRMRTQFATPKQYKASTRTEMLAQPKNQYLGKDFFQHREFRGLFLADHQEALGAKAFKCVDELNTQTVSQFGEVPFFKETLDARKSKEQFYKTQTRLKSFIKSSYKDKFGGRGTPLNVRLGMQDGSEDMTESGDEFTDDRKYSPSAMQNRLEGSSNKYDRYSTIKKEKAKMSQTFTQVTGDKFLPNVMQTPHN